MYVLVGYIVHWDCVTMSTVYNDAVQWYNGTLGVAG